MRNARPSERRAQSFALPFIRDSGEARVQLPRHRSQCFGIAATDHRHNLEPIRMRADNIGN
jgi:hypothetical protein